jgi:hypothetical protein
MYSFKINEPGYLRYKKSKVYIIREKQVKRLEGS